MINHVYTFDTTNTTFKKTWLNDLALIDIHREVNIDVDKVIDRSKAFSAKSAGGILELGHNWHLRQPECILLYQD